MQLHQHADRFHGGRRAANVLAREVLESEFGAAAALPEELGVEALGKLMRLCEKLRSAGTFEREEHLRRLHLGAAAVLGLDLERGRGFAQHRGDLEVAPLLVEKLHAQAANSTMRAR